MFSINISSITRQKLLVKLQQIYMNCELWLQTFPGYGPYCFETRRHLHPLLQVGIIRRKLLQLDDQGRDITPGVTCDLCDIWWERSGNMTWQKKRKVTKTKPKTMTMTNKNTFRDHLQRAILETCDLWDIWSEWWEDMTWPKNRQWQRKIHLESTFKERFQWLVTFEILITSLTI